MTLTTPLALLGLLTLPVIIALHALRVRSQRHVVSSLSLWNFLDAQISGARARRVPLTWLLFLDLLIAAFLTLALAQPELTLTRTIPNARHIVVILDVSTSMTGTDENPTRFARAQSDAADLLQTLTPLDTATLITFGNSVQAMDDTRNTNLQSLISKIQSLTPGETGSNLLAALALANAAKDPNLPFEIHLFTDAAYSISNLQSLISNTQYSLILHPYGQSANNQAILTLAPSPLSAQKLQLFARFANFADAPVTRRATLIADGNLVTSIDITLEANSTLPYTWDIIGNPTHLTVQLEGSDTLPADDSASLGLNTPPALTIALVTETPAEPDSVFDALTRALAAIPNITSQIIAPDQYLAGSAFDLVIFNGLLPSEKPTSNLLILGIEGDTPLDPTRILLQPHPFLTSLDLTGLRNLQRSTLNLPTWLADPPLQTLLEAEGQPLLQHGQTGQTQTTILSIDLTSGNLTQHPAFIILLNNILTYYRNLALPDQLPLGAPLRIPTGTGAKLLTPRGDTAVLSPTCPCDYLDTRSPGLYRLDLIDSGGSAQTQWIGINAGDLTESDITPNQFSVSSNQFSVPSTLEEPIQLAPYLLMLVLVLLFLEAYLAWK